MNQYAIFFVYKEVRIHLHTLVEVYLLL